MSKNSWFVTGRYEDLSVDTILIGHKFSFDLFYEQHFEVRKINIFHLCEILILKDLIQKFIGIGIVIVIFLEEED